MRAPPPVEFESALGRAWRAALSLVMGAAVAVPVAWGLPTLAAHRGSLPAAALREALGDPLAQGAFALGIAGVAMAAFWLAGRRAATGGRTLRWDGQDWVLADAAGGGLERRGDAALMLDLGPWMLVRFTATKPAKGAGPSTIWLPLTDSGDPARWAALRGALWNGRAGRGNAR